jgi:predicted membrane channel-forming protein YqfA (hemolysin III family)
MSTCFHTFICIYHPNSNHPNPNHPNPNIRTLIIRTLIILTLTPRIIDCFGAALVFCMSTCFHTFMCISPDHFFKLAKMDYIGILSQICGSMVGTIHFILNCNQVRALLC